MRIVSRISVITFIFLTILAINPKSILAQTLGDCINLQKNLTIGSRGDEVSELQEMLIEKGFDIPAISVRGASPGFFGEETKTAVIKYQKSLNLPSTGFVGPLTRGKINSACGGEIVVAKKIEPKILDESKSTATSSKITISNTRSSNILINDTSEKTLKSTIAFQFTLDNNSDSDIYIGNKAGNSIKAIVRKGSGKIGMTLISAEPAYIKGDTLIAYIIPKNSSRLFIANGRIDNTSGVAGKQVIGIDQITYSFDNTLSSLNSISTMNDLGLKLEIDLSAKTASPTPRPSPSTTVKNSSTPIPTQISVVTNTPTPTITTSQTPSPTQSFISTPTNTIVTPTPISSISSTPRSSPSNTSTPIPSSSQGASAWQAVKDLFGI